jgi:hypothetical protein
MRADVAPKVMTGQGRDLANVEPKSDRFVGHIMSDAPIGPGWHRQGAMWTS